MSTPSIAARRRLVREAGARGARGRTRLPAPARRHEGEPAWSRPLLCLVALLAGALTLWGLTRNGYANTYYAEAAQTASHSWTAWLTNAVDASGSVSVDKGPLSNMLMGLSGRLFGFSSLSMLVPEALCGIGSVLLLHGTVRRTLGPRAAILAALMLALTPIFVAISRFNNPDALLVLMEVAAAWALVRALESGRTRHVLLCGLLIGLAFNVKMLQAYLVVPALALTLLIAGSGRLRRRVAQLVGAGGVMIAVSFAWYGTMMLIPASDRPWVGDTTDNSWFTLIFGANGVSRVSGSAGGPGGGAGFGGSPGPLRLFNTALGGQIAWLLPLAVCGLALGLWSRRGAPRTDLQRSAYVLWGGWAVVSWAVFSFSSGIFHPYYTSALAPALAVLAAAALVLLWDRAGRSRRWAVALAACMIGTAALAALLLARASGLPSWLAPLAVALSLLAAAAVLARQLPAGRRPARGRMLARVALASGLLAILAGPAAYSVATVGTSLSGSNPLAGPAGANVGGLGGPRDAAGSRGSLAALSLSAARPRLGTLGATFRSPAGSASGAATDGRGGATLSAAATRTIVAYLETHQGAARYMAAAVGSSTAAQLALASGRDVVDVGGFAGGDPSPSRAALKRMIASGELHYVLLAGPGGGPRRQAAQSAATRAREAWIKRHGEAVRIPGHAGSGVTLYHLSSAS
jgi:4-amino-4-deoxy-L-arabinose transferase-like glycosyltransferase